MTVEPAEIAPLEVDGCAVGEIVRPGGDAELTCLVEGARRDRLALLPLGGRTALGIGNRPERLDVAVDLGKLAEIGDHSAADLVITAQAGVTLDSLNAFLERHGQVLPLEAPPGATLGGVVAAAQAGKRRFSRGTPRDWLIGARALTGDGRWIKAGAKVVKNVAGYDLLKLLCGSSGTLAILTELTFKVAPRPESTAIWRGSFEDWADVRTVSEKASALSAAWIELRVEPGGPLGVEIGFEGDSPAVDWQCDRLIERFASMIPAASGDTATPVPAGSPPELPLVPVSLPLRFVLGTLPDRLVAVLERCVGPGVVGIRGHLGSGQAILEVADPEVADPEATGLLAAWISAVEGADGWWRLDSGPKAGRECFGPARGEWAIGKEIKQLFDPDDILSPGRIPGAIRR